MKKLSDQPNAIDSLIGLGNHSARKSYYPELVSKLEELEEERNRYKWLFENALHGIFQAELDGPILTANPAIVAICGYPQPSQFCKEMTHIGQSLFCCSDAYKVFREKLLAAGKVIGFETDFRRIDGECVHISMNALLKQTNEGRFTIEVFVQDITERKKNQDRLKGLNEELELRVEQRTSELVTLNDKLWQQIAARKNAQKELLVAKENAEQANASKDKYLAAASHDLLQPMNAARLLISALRERPLDNTDAHLVERVHLALENAEDLLTDLLDISKLDQNAVQPDISEFRLSQLFNSMESEFQPVAAEKGLQIKALSSSVVVRSDSRLLLRILRNFISNAIRYTHQGRVLVGCRRMGEVLSIQVWDTGNGIPQDKFAAIFEEFHQLEGHRGSGGQGVGLGLAIVERIANMLQHPLRVRSKYGRGSMFSVEVPLIADSVLTERPKYKATAPLQSLDGLVVLVIDNEENILISMDALLSQWGCEVMIASSAEEAINLCHEEGVVPEVLLADFHLDDDYLGTDAITSIRRSLNQDIPAVILTADRTSECRQLFQQMHIPFLNKPVKPGKLRALLTHLLDK